MGWMVWGSNPGRGISFLNYIRTFLKPIHPPIQWVSEAITPRQGQGEWLQLYLYSPPNGLNFLDRDNFNVTAWFVVNSVRSLIPKDSGVLLKFYDFSTPSSKPLASKPTQWNLEFTFLRASFKINVKLRE